MNKLKQNIVNEIAQNKKLYNNFIQKTIEKSQHDDDENYINFDLSPCDVNAYQKQSHDDYVFENDFDKCLNTLLHSKYDFDSFNIAFNHFNISCYDYNLSISINNNSIKINYITLFDKLFKITLSKYKHLIQKTINYDNDNSFLHCKQLNFNIYDIHNVMNLFNELSTIMLNTKQSSLQHDIDTLIDIYENC